jgi:hypothetical protein
MTLQAAPRAFRANNATPLLLAKLRKSRRFIAEVFLPIDYQVAVSGDP